MISEQLTILSVELVRELSKIITGKLLTEGQIRGITGHVVGKHFADLFPMPQREAEAEARINSARLHITEASKIISHLQDDLEGQAKQLDALAREIEEKKKVAERYAVLAQTNQDALAAFKAELEETVRKELTAQSEKGKHIRRVASIMIWLVTLILGAALGAYLEISFEPIFQPVSK
jgi:DNA repair ATPase RecN